MNLHQKLVEIRKEIDVFTKDAAGYGYSYVSGSQVLGKIQEKMNELGVLLYPVIENLEDTTFDYQVWDRENKQMREKTDFVIKGNMTYVWQNAEKPDEKLEIPWRIYGQQDDISKAFGSGLTYSERYFLLKFFNAPTDDDDPDARKTSGKRATGGKASDKQLSFISNLIRQKSNNKQEQLNIFNTMISQLNLDKEMVNWTSNQASRAIKYLQSDADA